MLQTKKVAQSKKDLASVEEATKKVEARKASDQKVAKAGGASEADKAIAGFAQGMKVKLEQIRTKANHEAEEDASYEREQWQQKLAEKTGDRRTLLDRIAALEAAVSKFGGNIAQVEAGADARTHSRKATQKKISEARKKLDSIESKITGYDDKIKKAQDAKDTHAQIKLGTEQKDLEDEAKNIREKMKELYRSLERASAPADITVAAPESVEPAIAPPVEAAPMYPVTNSTSKVHTKVKELAEEQSKFKVAMKEAAAASKKRAAVVKAGDRKSVV